MKHLPKEYDPSLVEEKWYAFWKENHFFQADPNSDKPPFCIILPPPNVTGVLHMGHALVNTLQDILIRYKKMKGYEALWIPGTDHAGISTQTVVERHLHAKTGKRRSDFERSDFLQHVWEWKEHHQERILSQLQRLGSSLDWSRLSFTMDHHSTKAVKTMFKKLFDEGLIYRGDYLVNWDPVLQTAIADDEVEYEEHDSSLYYIKYKVEESDEYLTVATTRPETLLGDVAVAVGIGDKRFSHLVGKKVILPIAERSIPVIEDHYVNPEFGTGAVKMTPAHDFNDYEVCARHNLPLINILHPDGLLNDLAGEFAEMTCSQAREAIIKRLRDLGLIEKIEPYTHRVGVSYRTKAVIEPYLSKQWFIKMTPFKHKLKEAVESGRVHLIPEEWKKVYNHWINNLRDWCISRQLWWGHRIPVWYHKGDPTRTLCYVGEGDPPEVAQEPDLWVQDEDVLDTWFSSALWPLTTLGWPEKTPELKKFYPTSVLVTGHDILFFWVARMIAMGEYAVGEVPFHKTFVHGLIYGKSYWRTHEDGSISYVLPEERLAYELGEKIPDDVQSKWEKMSKSKGNVINPIEIIKQYGADAMRLALTSSVTHASQIDLDRRRFEEFKNFTNKVWNGARFILMNLEEQERSGMPSLTDANVMEGIDFTLFTLDDRWILSRLTHNIQIIEQAFDRYDFDVIAKSAYTFFWDEFCAYYLESCKPYLIGRICDVKLRANKQKLLLIVLFASIRLLHPIAPFITEEIFSLLRSRFPHLKLNPTSDAYTQDFIEGLHQNILAQASFPQQRKESLSKESENQWAIVRDVIYALRNIRAEMQIPPATPIDVYLVQAQSIEDHRAIIEALVKIRKLEFMGSVDPELPHCSTAFVHEIKIFVPLPEELLKKERGRLEKELEKQIRAVEQFQKKLSNPSFIDKAPAELVEKTRSLLKEAEETKKEIETKLFSWS